MHVTAVLWFLVCSGLISGMVLFRRNTINSQDDSTVINQSISVIIPARNEESNLGELLASLLQQSIQPTEIIVVDDHSQDRTNEIGRGYGVKVLSAPELPEDWTGKNWALWNGFLHSQGEILVFLDADVRLDPSALTSLVSEQQRRGGAISVVPYHHVHHFYEKFAMLLNVLGVFAFAAPSESTNNKKGLYGACIVTTREHYETIGGHRSVHSEMLDDLNLGVTFQRAGIPVTNYIGGHLIGFRMYPYGLKSELEGFAKGTVLSMTSIRILTLIPITLWVLGLIATEFFPFFIHTPYAIPLGVGYVLYALEFFYFNRDVGNFGTVHRVFHFLSTIFFLVVVGYSLYQSIIRKRIRWKGRYIHVGRGGKA